jgi:hypothetical protein
MLLPFCLWFVVICFQDQDLFNHEKHEPHEKSSPTFVTFVCFVVESFFQWFGGGGRSIRHRTDQPWLMRRPYGILGTFGGDLDQSLWRVANFNRSRLSSAAMGKCKYVYGQT